MAGLLVFVPATFLGPELGLPGWVQFSCSVVSVVPLAAFVGLATESLADQAGGKVGGVLNATFGNAPDLLIGVFGVQKNLIPLVKATLVGALISNSALIMGLCYLVAGLAYGRPRFRRIEAGHHTVVMMLAFAAVLLPSVGSFSVCGGFSCPEPGPARTVLGLSVGVGLILLLSYLAYLVFGIFGVESLRRRAPGAEVRPLAERARGRADSWPAWLSFGVLGGSTLLLVPVVDVLTGSVAGVTRVLGWSQVFVGIVIVANAGNVAEAYAAVRLALQRPGRVPGTEAADTGLDLAMGIASASSIQIAAFIAPLVVLYSLFAHPMNLVFSPVEVAILGLLVLISAQIAHDGESNWLEGLQLIALYAMAAVIFYVLPGSAFGG